jgi:hypothetical protein
LAVVGSVAAVAAALHFFGGATAILPVVGLKQMCTTVGCFFFLAVPFAAKSAGASTSTKRTTTAAKDTDRPRLLLKEPPDRSSRDAETTITARLLSTRSVQRAAATNRG